MWLQFQKIFTAKLYYEEELKKKEKKTDTIEDEETKYKRRRYNLRNGSRIRRTSSSEKFGNYPWKNYKKQAQYLPRINID